MDAKIWKNPKYLCRGTAMSAMPTGTTEEITKKKVHLDGSYRRSVNYG